MRIIMLSCLDVLTLQLKGENGISIGVTIIGSQNATSGANITLLVGQMQQDVSLTQHLLPNTHTHTHTHTHPHVHVICSSIQSLSLT